MLYQSRAYHTTFAWPVHRNSLSKEGSTGVATIQSDPMDSLTHTSFSLYHLANDARELEAYCTCDQLLSNKIRSQYQDCESSMEKRVRSRPPYLGYLERIGYVGVTLSRKMTILCLPIGKPLLNTTSPNCSTLLAPLKHFPSAIRLAECRQFYEKMPCTESCGNVDSRQSEICLNPCALCTLFAGT